MSKHPIDEMTEGCRFCAGEFPQVIIYSCGWCGHERIYILLVEDEEGEEMTAIPLLDLTVVSLANQPVTAISQAAQLLANSQKPSTV